MNDSLKRIISIFLVVITVVLALPTSVFANATALSGFMLLDNSKPNSSTNPYVVTSAADLGRISQLVAGGSDLSGVYFRQITSISLEGVAFMPIGGATAFCGTYDGGSMSITGLNLEVTDANPMGNVGLFGTVGNGGVVKNVSLSGKLSVALSMGTAVGGIVAAANGATISGCTFAGSITASSGSTTMVGGIAGYAENTSISACTNSATVSATGGALFNTAGGIVGRMDGGSLKSVNNLGSVASSDGTQVMAGGIVGSAQKVASVDSAQNSGAINADGGKRIAEALVYASGIVAYGDSQSTKITVSKNSGAIKATSMSAGTLSVGGIVGQLSRDFSVSSCTNSGAIAFSGAKSAMVGGIAAQLPDNSSITGSTNSGGITSTDVNFTNIGGIAGVARGTISSSSSNGGITVTSATEAVGNIMASTVGGIVGTLDGTVDGCASASQINAAGTQSKVFYGGSIAGLSGGTIRNSYSSLGSVTLDAGMDMGGGIVGMMNGGSSVTNCYTSTKVKAQTAGLIAGYAAGSIMNCYSYGSTEAAKDGAFISDGIYGMADAKATVEYCYWYITRGGTPTSMQLLAGGKCAYFSDASGTLINPLGVGVSVYGTKVTTLLEALNAFTSTGNNSSSYRFWTNAAQPNNSGLPVFGTASGNAITVSASSGGKVTPDKSMANPGAQVTLTIECEPGYVLSSLAINGSAVKIAETLKTFSFTMPDSKVAVSAQFAKKQTAAEGEHYITVGTIEGGTVKADKSTAKKGDTVKLTVTPKVGYRLSVGSLKVNGEEIKLSSDGYSFKMPDADVTITAKFIDGKGFSIKVANNITNGKIIVDRDSAVAGEKVTFTVIPDEGYAVKPGSVTVNGEVVNEDDDGVYSFSMASVNTTLRAQFIEDKDAPRKITVAETEHGRIICAKTSAKPGENVIVTIELDEGYRLKKGSLRANSGVLEEHTSGNYRFVMPSEDVTLTAVFEEFVAYKITLAGGIQNGKITFDKTEAGEGDTVKITVTPVPGYRLKSNSLKYNSIVVNKTGTAYTFKMPASNVTVSAAFELIPGTVTTRPKDEPVETTSKAYAISLGNIKNGTVLVGVSSARPGATVSVTPKPSSGYRLKNGTLKFNGKQIPNSASGYSFTMPSNEVVITAEFEKIALIAEYKVKVKNGIANGSITPSLTSAQAGTTVTVNVRPNSGYQLTSGSLKCNGTSIIPTGTSYRFVMPAEDVTLEASFEEEKLVTYAVNIADMTGGSVTSDVSSAMAGDKVTLTITPDVGNHLKDGSLRYNDTVIISSGDTCYFIMPEGDVTISAEFEAGAVTAPEVVGGYNVAVVAHSGGRIVKVGSNEAGDVSFSITPDDGYAVSDVIVDNRSVGAVNSYTFEQITGEHTIEAFFAKIEEEADAMEQLKNMMLTAGIVIVSSILIITALVLLIISITRAAGNGIASHRRSRSKKKSKKDDDVEADFEQIDTTVEDNAATAEFDAVGNDKENK